MFSEAAVMSDLYPWLESPRDSITAVINKGRMPHALLLTGLSGVGKGLFATYLARQLLCENRTTASAPCGQCPGCVQFKAGSHPDFYRVRPEEDATVIKVDQIRQLSEHLSLSSHRGGYQVVVVDPAETMNLNAANSLLKTLEEPSDNTVLVLISARPAQLPATVRSRCQQLRIEVPDSQLALHWLREQGVGESAQTCLQLAHGAPLEALKQAQIDSIGARRERFNALMGILENRISPLTVAQGWCKDEDMQGIRWMREWLMDLLRVSMTGQASRVRSADLQDGLSILARRLDNRVIFELLDRINRILRLAAGSLNRQLLTEDILLAWAAQR
jgi:DNA polymerase-3 subunit delta'